MAARKKQSKSLLRARRGTSTPPSPSAISLGLIDACGHRFEAFEDPELKIQGECDYEAGTIRVAPKENTDRVLDSVVHEALHALIDSSGLGWSMRRRLGMSEREWRHFEEDFIVRPMAPALLSTLRSAPWLLRWMLLPRKPTRKARKPAA
jgi:hypothetical protein